MHKSSQIIYQNVPNDEIHANIRGTRTKDVPQVKKQRTNPSIYNYQ